MSKLEIWKKAVKIVDEDVCHFVGLIGFIAFFVIMFSALKGGSDGTEPILIVFIIIVVTIATAIVDGIICLLIFLYLMIKNYCQNLKIV